MKLRYDEALGQIDFYKIHPEYLPFVGNNFDEFRVLHVGESHYIGQNNTYAPFDLKYFDKWWTDHCDTLYKHPDGDSETKCWGSWYNTREVIGRFLNRNQSNYSIFINMIRAFDEAVEGLTACDDEKQTVIGGRKVSYGTQQNKPLSEVPTAAFEAFLRKIMLFSRIFSSPFSFRCASPTPPTSASRGRWRNRNRR